MEDYDSFDYDNMRNNNNNKTFTGKFYLRK